MKKAVLVSDDLAQNKDTLYTQPHEKLFIILSSLPAINITDYV